MIAVLLILAFVVYLTFFFPVEAKPVKEEKKSPKYEAQMKKLWQIAQTSMKERKPFRAEKALLTILKFDEKNAVAYNRLGILYAKDKRYDEAVECFEIAQSLDNNPASIHNAGLIYLETGAYEKAEMAFLQAIEMEGDVPARYMALAKAEEKLGNYKKAVEALENAYELDPNVTVLRQILAIFETTGDTEAATATTARIEAQVARDGRSKSRRTLKAAAKKTVEKIGTKAPVKAVSRATSKLAPKRKRSIADGKAVHGT
ncbi:tetratricopeptide repeat protein [Candidatus Saccharibacteria bacterium]|nr:tetratricopeptide repeat protein [Candidatus Saccharibacteria bacterium]